MSRTPMYRKIFDRLNREIASGHYRAGEKFPSEAALVERFGASRITVGHALRELQQRGMVDRIAGSGTYVRKPERPRERLLFGLIIPNFGETEIFEPICKGIVDSPAFEGHALIWGHAMDRPGGLSYKHVAGVFFAPLEGNADSEAQNRKVMKSLHDEEIPVVLLDRRPEEHSPRNRADLVGIDNHRAGFLATEHLLNLGARRIGFLSYENQASTVRLRISGYADALTRRSVAPESFVIPANGTLDLRGKARHLEAFVCANDRVAGHLMHMLGRQGIRVPQDMRIVGIDDVSYASLLPVPLTTIHQPCKDIGEAALRMMLERLDRPKMPARDVLLDCELVIRESCGAATS